MAYLTIFVIVGDLSGCRSFGDILYLAGAVAITSIISYFGFIMLCENKDKSIFTSEQKLRFAITSSIVVTYLVNVFLGVYFVNNVKMPEFARYVLLVFTCVTSLVLGFYFGASAYTQKKNWRF
jgi:undecaprenyl pyrophosphate phosphatase UppP